MVTKRVHLKLVGLDGNAFSLMGAFSHQAWREGWTKVEIDEVMNECKKGDYNNLLRVLSSHCTTSEDFDE